MGFNCLKVSATSRRQFTFYISTFLDHHLIKYITSSRAGKVRSSGARKSVLLKASSGGHCAPQNVVHLATFRGTRVHLIVYLVVHQMKYLMER